MDDRCTTARKAGRWFGGILLLVAIGCPAAPAHGASPLVRVDRIHITAHGSERVIHARVTWNRAAMGRDNLVDGTIRAVAVTPHTHKPTMLGRRLDVDVDLAHHTRHVRVVVRRARELRAMAKGNRVVLTATQHLPPVASGGLTPTLVTVGQAQPYGSPQPRIGTEDCSDRPVEPGVIANLCDFVGADFDNALISIHDPDASEGRVDSGSSRFQRADFTGATMVGADISGASVAGGRMNGADMTNAKLDNLSLADTEAIGLIAYNARSDRDAKNSAANAYATNLTGADLRKSQFNGVSFERARLDGAKMQGAIWNGVQADGASFRTADMTGARLGPGMSLGFADLTGATLTDTDLSDLQLSWVTFCGTALPSGISAAPDRDCRGAVEADPLPFPTPDDGRTTPYVTVSGASVSRDGAPRRIQSVVTWDADSADVYDMDAGDVRVLAVDRQTGLPTELATIHITDDLPDSSPVDVTIDPRSTPHKYAAMRAGNRIVLSATQHPQLPRSGALTARSYVTVRTLQKGAGRGRVGQFDCSRVAITRLASNAIQDFCDLTGATLTGAGLDQGSRFLREADLTGAQLDRGAVTATTMDGSWLAGVNAQGATWTNVGLVAARAPALDLSDGRLSGSRLRAANLRRFGFARASMDDTTLAGTPMAGADFTNAKLNHPDLAYTRLRGAKLAGVVAVNHPSLFQADLTSASLAGSSWGIDESGERPWTWATLCHTAMPPGVAGGDRDCPR